LAQRLKEAREELGLSQGQAADLIGSTQRSLTRWENAGCDPGFATVAELARELGVSLDWLAGRTPVRDVLTPNSVLVDIDVLEELRALDQRGASLDDVPTQMVRNPGIQFAHIVPERTSIFDIGEALEIEKEVQTILGRLAGRKQQ
jgi:transcriptional regulator with XRE-family HTH domain